MFTSSLSVLPYKPQPHDPDVFVRVIHEPSRLSPLLLQHALHYLDALGRSQLTQGSISLCIAALRAWAVVIGVVQRADVQGTGAAGAPREAECVLLVWELGRVLLPGEVGVLVSFRLFEHGLVWN